MNYEQVYENKQESYFSHSRPELLPFVPANLRKVLDVGCGNGAFGAMLKKNRQCEVWGIEPSKAAALEAEKHLDKVINGLFIRDMPEMAGQKFDVIFFNDVLEHLVDPDEALSYCKQLLNPNGCVIASIPNIRWYPVILSLIWYKDFKYEEAGVMDKTHLRFFTVKGMRRLFENNGYKVISAEGINDHINFPFFNFVNFLTFKIHDDMKFPQFAIVAAI
jgi:2-polyprenyl-3-methyl-5-hydroxy-6-metoxy-1,4-benzoquinol methylase